MYNEAEQLLIKHDLHRTFWGKIMVKAEVIGRFTGDEKELAEEWTTCACGYPQSPLIPRDSLTNEPIDSQLSDLGVRFDDVIARHDFFKAAEILVDIEKRAEVVLNELEKTNEK